MNLHYITAEKKREVAAIKAGELFLLPAYVPHSPRRGEGSWTLVIERKRRPDEQDFFVWFCEGCNAKLYETTVRFDDPTDAVKLAIDRIRSDEKLRTCSHCSDESENVGKRNPRSVPYPIQTTSKLICSAASRCLLSLVINGIRIPEVA